MIVASTSLAVIGVCVLAFVLSQPKEGSVEWHKREYLATMKRLAPHSWRSQMRRAGALIFQGKPWEWSQEEATTVVKKVKHHENMLVALGFLEAREIPRQWHTNVVGNVTTVMAPRMVVRTHESEIFDANGLTRKYANMSPYARTIPSGMSTIVIGVPDDIPKLEAIIHDEDAESRRRIKWE